MQSWEDFLKLQEKELGPQTVQKWLRTLKVLHFDACNLYLEAQDAFHVNWFEEHLRQRAQENLLNNNKKPIKIHFSIPGNEVKKSRKKKDAPAPQKFSIAFDALDPHCTFDLFVSHPGNALAFQLLNEKYDSRAFNPIYLYGASGSGKTHLLMAAAAAFKEQGLSVVYTRAETFTEHVVTAIRAGEMRLFRQSYRTADVLMIDDAHLFSRKTATQEELFHTFNALHTEGKQIILSANCTPSEMTSIEPRLISRFEWGIVVPLETPSQDILRTIISIKAKALKCEVPPAIIELLIELFPSGCKAMTRALEALLLRMHLKDKTACLRALLAPEIKKFLKDLIEEEQHSAATPQKVIQQVTEFFGIPEEEVLGKSQSRECVLPRQIAMYLCRIELEMPYTHIGEIFGRDHSTVMSSIKLVKKGLDNNDPQMTQGVRTLQKKLWP